MNSTETPGGAGIPAGWYDDPSGPGLRWWDGNAWTEHVHTAESAAAAAGADATSGTSGSREGAPPRDLVKLREWIRSRGTKGIGIVLGAVVVVIVVIVLLVSGGGSDNGGGQPGVSVPGSGQGNPAAAKAAAIKAIDKQLKNKKLPKAERKQLVAQKKKLEKGNGSAKGAGKSAKKQGDAAKKKVAPGEEGN